ncbi:hypothetical protein ACFYVL_39140 [Streptomyces sp. NPDC004111]|uniref:hypothetical protein n=1 Tax=Streptomyces sp. NPDC004111 TaxID=3364690 RepID=UPI0036CD57FF
MPAPPAPLLPPPPSVSPPPAASSFSPPPPPPPPPYGAPPPPVPVQQPSALGQFAGRVLRTGWAGAAKAAAWPLGLLLLGALALAVPTYGQDGDSGSGGSGDGVTVGFGDRWRAALAVLYQGFGAGLEIRARAREFGSDPSTGSGGGVFGDPFGGGSGGSGSGYGSDWPDPAVGSGFELSVVPLTVTVLWIGALLVGARMLRRALAGQARATGQQPSRTTGLEAAVRVTLLVTAGVLLLGLFAQPAVEEVELSISPVLAALCAGALALVVTAGVLLRDDLAQWAGRRPGTALAVRALGTAARAMGIAVALCTVAGFVLVATADGTDGDDLLSLLPLLPNLGLLVLGFSWGVPLDYDVQGRLGFLGLGSERGSIGLPEAGEELGAGAVVGALALGLVCVLVLAVLAGRRLRGQRGGQLLAGGLFLGLFLILEAIAGASFTASGGIGELGSVRGTGRAGPNIPYALLFGLAWVAGAMVVAAYTGRTGGGQGGGPDGGATPHPGPGFAPGGTIPPQPGGQPTGQGYGPDSGPGQPTGQGYGPGSGPGQPTGPGYGPGPGPSQPTGQGYGQGSGPGQPTGPGHGPNQGPAQGPGAGQAPGQYFSEARTAAPAVPAARRSPALVWGGTVLAAFAVGGGVTAGVLLLQDGGRGESAGSAASVPATPTAPTAPTAVSGPTAASGPSAGRPGSAGPSAPDTLSRPSATPAASAPPPGTSGAVPAGFRRVDDPEGFSLAVPAPWTRTEKQRGQITYAGSTGKDHLVVGVVPNAPYASSYDNFRTLEQGARNRQRGYQRIRLERNTFQGRPGALWEYTYTEEQGGRTVHAVDQGYIAPNGTDYSLYVTAYDSDWQDGAQVFDRATSTWRLTR